MGPQEWLDTVRGEYLHTFVPAGGAAVKFAVSSTDAGRTALRDGLRAEAEAEGFQLAFVDARTTRLHLVDRLFHAVARQVDWTGLARAYVARLLEERGLRAPADGEPLDVASVAALNGYQEMLLRTELRRAIENRLLGDEAMSRELRLAMIHLCLGQLDPSEDPRLREAILEWLRGDLRLVSEVKRALIFQRVARHNARHLLASLAHWLTLTGKRGLVLCLDVARYGTAVRPADRDESLYYSTPAALDMYEVLRQFVDGTDEMAHCFVAVLAGPEFLQDDRRGVRGYQALYFRVWDEVYDRVRENPLSSLARIAAPV